MKEYNKGYKDGYNTALKEADIYSIYPYNLMLECDGTTEEYDITPKELKKCMADHLTDRECQVLEYRFHQNITLDEIAHKFNVTKERIRQIEQRALRKLRYYIRGYQVVPMSQVADAVNRYNELQANYKALQTKYENKYQEPVPEPVHTVPIEKLDLSVRSYNCLKRAKIHYLDDLKKLSEEDLMNIRNMGKKSVQEIMFRLSQYGGGQ